MLSLREPILGIPQYVGVLSDELITLNGIAVRRRWSSRGDFEISPTKRKERFSAAPGDSLCLWGPTLEQTEPVTLVAVENEKLTVKRGRRRVRDGVVQVVRT